MTWAQLQEYIKDKVFLIGLTFVDKDGEQIEQYQTYGVVSELTNDGLLHVRRKDDSVFRMPYDKETIRKADKGEYREKATGEIVKDPDFIMTWEIIIPNESYDLADIKTHGYNPAS